MRNLGTECSLRLKKETLWFCNLKMNFNFKNVYISLKKTIFSTALSPRRSKSWSLLCVLMIFKCRCIQWIYKLWLFIFFKLTFQCPMQSEVKLTFSSQTIYNFERFYVMVNIHIIIRFPMRILKFFFFLFGVFFCVWC